MAGTISTNLQTSDQTSSSTGSQTTSFGNSNVVKFSQDWWENPLVIGGLVGAAIFAFYLMRKK